MKLARNLPTFSSRHLILTIASVPLKLNVQVYAGIQSAIQDYENFTKNPPGLQTLKHLQYDFMASAAHSISDVLPERMAFRRMTAACPAPVADPQCMATCEMMRSAKEMMPECLEAHVQQELHGTQDSPKDLLPCELWSRLPYMEGGDMGNKQQGLLGRDGAALCQESPEPSVEQGETFALRLVERLAREGKERPGRSCCEDHILLHAVFHYMIAYAIA